ncbi:MAG: TIGR02996 domain-containing protein [Polyangiales bacterium]
MRDRVDEVRLRDYLAGRPTRVSFASSRSQSGVDAWVKGFAELGKPVCVRVAVAAARAALEAWETYEPAIREGGPYERIAAAEAWLACPCEAHEEIASQLAWANGDDSPLKWTSMVVNGNAIESMEAIYAHWSSDNAVSVTANDLSLAAQIIETAFGAAEESLSKLHPRPECTLRVIARIVRELGACLTTSPQETAFLEALDRDPADDATRQVYADWLEESGRTREAKAVRGDAIGARS